MTILGATFALNTSAISWFALGAAGLALVIWWIVLVRRRKIWFPLLRRLVIPPRVKPKIRFERPPLIPFFCFLAAASAAVMLSNRPATIESVARNRPSIRSHLLVDLSPSVSRIPLQDLSARAGEVWEFLAKSGKVTVGTTSSFNVAAPLSREQVERILMESGYARAGVRLGGVLQKQLQGIDRADESDAIDRVVVLSDDDRHSWAGLNLAWFHGGTRLFRVNAQKPSAAPENLFIDAVRKLSADDPATVQAGAHGGIAAAEIWEVELIRRSPQAKHLPAAVSGTLEVLDGDQVAGRTSWNFPAGSTRLVMSVEIRASGDRLLFRLDPASTDLIRADNEFRSWRDPGAGRINLVSEPVGEGLMQESSWQLTTVLSLLGFEVVRHDSSEGAMRRLRSDKSESNENTLDPVGQDAVGRDTRWILLVGVEGHAGDVCSHSMVSQLKSGDSVWLAPRNLSSSWRDLCDCYVRLAGVEPRRDFCANVNSRSAWSGLLPSLGARQVGGKLGDENDSFAWRGVLRGGDAGVELNGNSGDLLAFVMPLMPSVSGGINHARFPLIVRELIRFQTPTADAKAGSWPRIADSAADGASKMDDLLMSNVPAAESLMQEAAQTDLPELLRFGGIGKTGDDLGGAPSGMEQRQNPWPWVRSLAGVAGGAILFELIWMGWRRWFGSSALFMIGALLWWTLLTSSDLAHAAVVEMVIAGDAGRASFTRLSREVAARTSITLAKKARGFALTGSIPDVPWIWVDGIAAIVDTSRAGNARARSAAGHLRPEIGNWLRRGGLLVIEGVSDKARLDALFSKEFPVDGGWQPVPTDHELMRSFYLLDALPSCGSSIWHQFSFDGRVAAVALPVRLTKSLQDGGGSACPGEPASSMQGGGRAAQSMEMQHRAFVNLLMVALTTDYKKDQVHLPEILKRLR
jgi:hypothetical protein